MYTQTDLNIVAGPIFCCNFFLFYEYKNTEELIRGAAFLGFTGDATQSGTESEERQIIDTRISQARDGGLREFLEGGT